MPPCILDLGVAKLLLPCALVHPGAAARFAERVMAAVDFGSMSSGRPMRAVIPPLLGAVAILAGAATTPATGAEWKAGMASVRITPTTPVRMAGYAARVQPFKDVEQDLFAKALVLEDRNGRRAVLVTTDLIGIRAALAEEIFARIPKALGLERAQVLFTASHTHSGPALTLETESAPDVSPEDAARTAAYTRRLVEELAALVVRASEALEPVRLFWGSGVSHFAVNRRQFTPDGVILGVNPRGPVDRSVPVLRVDGADGTPRAAVFGYACHNTTLTGGNYSINGDFSGFAQTHIQERFPGIQAMFVTGTGADANPYPRGTMELARRHGADLGEEVSRVLSSDLREIKGPLQVAFAHALLPLQQHSRAELERIVAEGPGLHRHTARQLLARLDRGEAIPAHYAAPVAVWQFGSDLTLVALSGEVVVDYAYALEKGLGPLQLWLLAYSNDYFGYLPSPRVLEEGGYETRGLFSNDGWFSPEASDVLVRTVRDLAAQTGRTLPPIP
jgi:neutral ceramidase